MHTLITGYTGFIGSHLVPSLQHKGYSITGVSRKRSDQQKFDSGGVVHITWAQLKDTDLSNLTAIIHLAGKAHDLSGRDSKEYEQANVDLTKNVIDLFNRSNASKFIYLSSIKAVADQSDIPLTEEMTPHPNSIYGESKLSAEKHILKNKHPDKKYYILRPGMVYGPGNKGNLALLYKAVKRGIPYPFGQIQNGRSLLSIDNLNFVIGELLDRDLQDGIYHLADNLEISTREIVELMYKARNKKPLIWNFPETFTKLLTGTSDILGIGLTSEKMKKLTGSFRISNQKIRSVLQKDLPVDTYTGLLNTFKAFND